MSSKKVTVPALAARKLKNKKIVMLTAYDATFARLADDAGADMLLVGDSLGMVIQGHDNTIPVTLDDVIYHTRCVARGARRPHICADMPFMTYKVSSEEALHAAGRLIQEGRAESVKLEGGAEMAETIARVVSAGIPVVGHVGLTPQSVHSLGGFKMQGKTSASRDRIIQDAKAVADAGAFCLVLESMPAQLAETITEEVTIPTVGIGAGPHCDGQVLVIYDMLGMNEGFKPKFLKLYASMGGDIKRAVATYAEEVRAGAFPAPEHTTTIDQQPQGELYGGGSKDTRH